MIGFLLGTTIGFAAFFGVTALLLRRAYRKIGVKQERIDDLTAMVDSQTEFLRDVRPLHDATLRVRDEAKAIDARMQERAETARITINRLRAFLGAVIARLDPEVAVVAQRNVDIMMAQLPPLMPEMPVAPPPTLSVVPNVTA